MKIDANKVIGVLLAAMLGMAAWYLQQVARELRDLRGDVRLCLAATDAVSFIQQQEDEP